MKQLEVKIMGQGYLLGCPEGGEQRLRDAVYRVDAAMCKIRDAGKIKARDRIAVLAALNLAFELAQAQRQAAPAAAANAPTLIAAESGNDTDRTALTSLLARLDDALLSDDGQLL
ncbi:MAG: cell division protein ZapA [Burkholderiaceae bacterium]|jgi:cell division protein ZapA|nr:cell division protein ZapA [Burkholderiaceae bacterium]